MRSIFKEDYFNNIFSSIKQKSKWAYNRIIKGYCEYDSYEVNSWFLQTAPDLIDIVEKKMTGTCMEDFISNYLEEHFDEYKITYQQYQFEITKEEKERIFDICVEEYHKVLKEMSFYLKEAYPETCSKVNKYQNEYEEHLLNLYKIENKSSKTKKTKSKDYRADIKECFGEDKDIVEKYHKERDEIDKYRNSCKKKGLALFVKYFDDLGW